MNSALSGPYRFRKALTRHWVEATGSARLAIVEDGDRSAPPLALINMAATNLTMWEPLIPHLMQDFRVIRHDIRGTGESSAGSGAQDFDIEIFAEDLVAILDALHVERAIVWGASFGARIGLQLAVRRPERVALLAVFDSTLGPPPSRAERDAGQMAARMLRRRSGVAEVAVRPSWFRHVDPRLASQAFQAAHKQVSLAPKLPDVGIPTLVATGRQDTNFAASERIASLLPIAEFVAIEMAGHGSVLQRPDATLSVFLTFVRRRAGGSLLLPGFPEKPGALASHGVDH